MQLELKTAENPVSKDICRNVIASWNDDVLKLKKSLPVKSARDIKTWRVGEGPHDMNTHSWRSIAQVFVEKYPEFAEQHNLIAGNQISGMMLCEAAMIKLKETVEQGWN